MSKQHLAKLALALALVGAAAGGAMADSQEQMARDLVPAQKPVYNLGGTHQEAEQGVDAWVDNPEGIYRVGQQLKVFVRPRETSYITALNVGTSGKVAVIFPNYYQRDARVRAGQTVAIPAERSGWHINVAGPAGVEVIKVIASRERLNLAELERLGEASERSPVLSLERSGEAVARDLVPQLKQPSGGGAHGIGVRNLLVRVIERGAALPTLPHAYGLSLRPERPIYRIGETVRVAVNVKQDCELSVDSFGTSGRVIRLFPNRFQPDGFIRAGQTVVVPSPHAPFAFKAQGPVGVEGLLATCRSVGGGATLGAKLADNFAVIGDLPSVTRDLVAAPARNRKVERVSSSFIVTN
ncbi:MAG TPA: DUF4384 domain-containing protein [Hyphomicrobiaceae bacterium]|nr:DUF4384 domain-containing protein [Hyphomicrobiaceae bacterium]